LFNGGNCVSFSKLPSTCAPRLGLISALHASDTAQIDR
jgi:hypothetical protein